MRFKFNSTKTAVKFEIVNGKPHFIDTKGGHWTLRPFSDDPESLGNARRYKDQLSPVGHDGGYHPVFEGSTSILSGYDIDPEKNKLKINSVAPSTDVPVIRQRRTVLTTPMISVHSYTKDGIEKIKDEESKVHALLDAYKSALYFNDSPFAPKNPFSYTRKNNKLYNSDGELIAGPPPPNFTDASNPFRPVHIVTVHLPDTDGPKSYYLDDSNYPAIEESYPGIQRVASPDTLEKYSGILQKIIRTPALEDKPLSHFLDTSTIKPGHVITVRHNYPGSSFHHPVIDVERQYYLLDHVHPGIEAAYPGIQRLGRKEIIGLKEHMQSDGDIALDNNELNTRNELLVPAKVLGQGVGSSFQMPAEGNPELLRGGTNKDYKEPAYIDCKIIGIEAPDLSLFDFDKNEK